MADLTDFQVTDDVTDNIASLHNRLLGGQIRAEFVNTETISATKELADNDCQYQVITASGANRTVELAPEATTNHITIIYNTTPSSDGYTIAVKDDSGTSTYATISPDAWAMFIPFSGEGWKPLDAEAVPITDAGTYYTGATVEAALQEIGAAGLVTYSFPIQAGTYNNTPSASTTYYYGGVFGGTWGTSAGARILYVGKACILKAVYTVLTYSGTAANNTALYFRLNNSTDTTLSTTIALGGSPTVVSATGLSTAVAAGDYFEMKIVFGASTVPSAVSVSSILWFDES